MYVLVYIDPLHPLCIMCTEQQSSDLYECSALYLAVIHGGCKLVGTPRQLRPLVEVHPPAHVVKMLEIEDWHYGETKKGIKLCTTYLQFNFYFLK